MCESLENTELDVRFYELVPKNGVRDNVSKPYSVWLRPILNLNNFIALISNFRKSESNLNCLLLSSDRKYNQKSQKWRDLAESEKTSWITAVHRFISFVTRFSDIKEENIFHVLN